MSNVSNNSTGSSSIDTPEKTGAKTVSSSIWVRKNSRGSKNFISCTPLSLFWGGGSSSSIISSSEFSLGSSNFSSVLNSNGEGKVENGSNKWGNGWGDRSNRKVGSGYSETVNGVGDVVDSLEKTIGINILVGAGGNSIGITGLRTG